MLSASVDSTMLHKVDHSLSFLIVFLFLIISTPDPAKAGGPIHGAKGAGMGTAFVAVADDGSAMAVNPAGLAQLEGTNIYGGVAALNLSTRFNQTGGGSEKTDFNLFSAPHLYLTSDFGLEKARFGLGIFSPFGIGGREWSKEGLTRFVSTENIITTLTINPTIAYKIRPGLSVGFGVNYMISKNKSSVMIDQSAMGARDAELQLDEKGDGWGVNVGLLYALNEKLRLGFAYRNKIAVASSGSARLSHLAPALQPLFGGSTFKTRTQTDLHFPDVFSLGIAYRPTKKWLLAFDLEQVRWSSFETSILDFKNEVPAAGFTDKETTLDWKDVVYIKFGLAYQTSPSFAVRGGYAFYPSFVPGHSLSPANPEADNHNISLGFGYAKGKFLIDSFFTAGFYEKRTVGNNILNGRYKNAIYYTGFSLGYRLED